MKWARVKWVLVERVSVMEWGQVTDAVNWGL